MKKSEKKDELMKKKRKKKFDKKKKNELKFKLLYHRQWLIEILKSQSSMTMID